MASQRPQPAHCSTPIDIVFNWRNRVCVAQVHRIWLTKYQLGCFAIPLCQPRSLRILHCCTGFACIALPPVRATFHPCVCSLRHACEGTGHDGCGALPLYFPHTPVYQPLICVHPVTKSWQSSPCPDGKVSTAGTIEEDSLYAPRASIAFALTTGASSSDS